jgi:CBS domain-containing protein
VEGWDGTISGIVSQDVIRSVPESERVTTRVVDVALPMSEVTTVAPDEKLVDVVSRPGVGQLPFVLVFAAEALVGVLTPADLQRAAGLRTADRV